VLASDQIVLGDSTGHADGSQGGLALKSVQFDGYSVEVGASGGNQDFQSISLDSGKGIYPTDQPEWLDTTLNGQIGTSTFLDGTIAPLDPDGAVDIAAPHSWPISYERSLPDETAYMLAKPVFAFKGIVTGVWEVQGNSTFGSSDAVTLGPADLTQGDGTLSATVTSDQPIPDTIESQSLTITWRVSFDGGKTWIVAPVGVSANHLFVTGGSAPSAYETVLWLGSNGEPTGLRPHNPDEDNLVSHSWPNGEANGMDIAVADAIFTNFSGLDTKRVDRTEMVYVPSQIGSTASVPLSRADGHGQCSSWADLLFDTLTAQGVAASKLLILPANPYNKFKVRNADVQGGIALAPPSTQFNFHVVVMISADPDRIYDASFGVTTDSGDAGTVELQWEEDHVIDFGFPALAGFSPTGAAIFVEQWLGLNPAGQQLRWSPWPF
jgi:hypothetical protein